MNRIRKTKGYSSKRTKPNSASVLTRIHTVMTPVCPMMNAHEPINVATRSAMRSPALCLSTWASCQFLMLSFLQSATGCQTCISTNEQHGDIWSRRSHAATRDPLQGPFDDRRELRFDPEELARRATRVGKLRTRARDQGAPTPGTSSGNGVRGGNASQTPIRQPTHQRLTNALARAGSRK